MVAAVVIAVALFSVEHRAALHALEGRNQERPPDREATRIEGQRDRLPPHAIRVLLLDAHAATSLPFWSVLSIASPAYPVGVSNSPRFSLRCRRSLQVLQFTAYPSDRRIPQPVHSTSDGSLWLTSASPVRRRTS